jgi:hypothetical protein
MSHRCAAGVVRLQAVAATVQAPASVFRYTAAAPYQVGSCKQTHLNRHDASLHACPSV